MIGWLKFSTYSRIFVLMDRLEALYRHTYIEAIRELTAPFHERDMLIKEGKLLEAISKKPSGIWYANRYAEVLKALGSTKIPVNGGVRAAHELYQRFKETGQFFFPFASNKYWENVESPSCIAGKHPVLLRLKRDVSATEAFKSFSQQLSFVECNTIMDIAAAWMLIKIYGGEKFDTFINRYTFMHGSLEIGGCNDKDFLRAYTMKESSIQPQIRLEDPCPPLSLGHQYYVSNFEGYWKKHPHGQDRGCNLFYAGVNATNEPIFIALGLDPKGATLSQVFEHLRESHNQLPLESSDLAAGKSLLSARHITCIANVTNGKRSIELTAEDIDALSSDVRLDIEQRLKKIRQHTLTREEFLSRGDLFKILGRAKTLIDLDIVSIHAAFGCPSEPK